MKIDEVCLNTNDVIRLADFYRTILDIDATNILVLKLGTRIIGKPTLRPWGAINMSFYDPDDNVVYFRCLPK